MLVELSIVPLGCDVSWSDELAEILKRVDASGLPYVLTPSGTCIEGEWDPVMALVHQCHDLARRSSPHVLTSIRIEDEEGVRDQLTRNIASVEDKLGRTLRKLDPRGPRAAGESSAPTAPSVALADRPRYDQLLEQLAAAPEPGSSSPAPSD
jgi:uncharacterized protein (TIGR00106 family)